MNLKHILMRFFVAIFVLNVSGVMFSAEQILDAGAHEAEYVTTAASTGDCENNLAACKAHCQSHCAQHFTVLPSGIAALVATVTVANAPLGLVSTEPDTRASSLFRPPRTLTL